MIAGAVFLATIIGILSGILAWALGFGMVVAVTVYVLAGTFVFGAVVIFASLGAGGRSSENFKVGAHREAAICGSLGSDLEKRKV